MQKITLDHPAEPNQVLVGSFLSRGRTSSAFSGGRTASTYSLDKHAKVHYSQISGGKREILSIDDDPTNQVIQIWNRPSESCDTQIILRSIVSLQMVVEDLLIPLGYVVTCAMDGVEGLEILASRDYLPDLILLDVQMPLMTGYEVICRIICPLFMFLIYLCRSVPRSAGCIQKVFLSS